MPQAATKSARQTRRGFPSHFRAMGSRPQQHPLCQGASALTPRSEGLMLPATHRHLCSAQPHVRREQNISFGFKHLQMASQKDGRKTPSFPHLRFFCFLRPCKSHPGFFAGAVERFWIKNLHIFPGVPLKMPLPHVLQSLLVPQVSKVTIRKQNPWQEPPRCLCSPRHLLLPAGLCKTCHCCSSCELLHQPGSAWPALLSPLRMGTALPEHKPAPASPSASVPPPTSSLQTWTSTELLHGCRQFINYENVR